MLIFSLLLQLAHNLTMGNQTLVDIALTSISLPTSFDILRHLSSLSDPTSLNENSDIYFTQATPRQSIIALPIDFDNHEEVLHPLPHPSPGTVINRNI